MNAPDPRYMVQEFARRTRINLESVENKQLEGSQVFEVTQLINSTVDLLVFPIEKLLEQIKLELGEDGIELDWGKILIRDTGSFYGNEVPSIRFLKLCRNAFCHGNIDLGKEYSRIRYITLWNYPNRVNRVESNINIQAKISTSDLRKLLFQLSHILEEQLPKLQPYGEGTMALVQKPDLMPLEAEVP